eukprot:1157308-Pelagomonas_calceolata.AAC.11
MVMLLNNSDSDRDSGYGDAALQQNASGTDVPLMGCFGEVGREMTAPAPEATCISKLILT